MQVIGAHLRNSAGSWSRRTTFATFLTCGLLASLAPAAGAETFSNPAPITIPATGSNAPATPYPSEIPVTGLTGGITDVNVTLKGYSHEFPSDTHVVLVPPGSTGQNILLMAGAGGDDENAILPPGVDITLDDGNPPLPDDTLQSGTYKPTARSTTGVFPAPGPGNNFCSPGIAAPGTPSYVGGNCSLADAFNATEPNGTWKLYVIDIGAPDAGVIAGGWTLEITAGGPVAPAQRLTVSKTGTGTGGTVRGLGISCPTVCTKDYKQGTSVTLTAAGDAFSEFKGFTGPCENNPTPTTTTCTVTMDQAKNVTATFAGLPRTLNVGKVGSGSGTVTGPGINCGPDCGEAYPTERSATLTATPAAGSRFTGWIGCESPSANRCTVNATRHKWVTARFTQNPVSPPPPKPSPPGGGNTGSKVINGTSGSETINGTPGDDVINCGDGNDVVNAGAGNDVINCGGGDDRVNGNEGNDRIDGGSGKDLLSGNEGNDRVVGGSGNDRANGNSGNDRVGGQSGNDRVGGQSGKDILNGESGRDLVGGGSGNDRTSGGSGNDRVNGDSGNDRVSGGSGNDRVSGLSGNDRVNGDNGNDRLSGGSGNDRLSGGSGNDRLDGGRGRDRLDGGRGRDREKQ